MKWIFDLALRNIKRNRRRTILAVTSIALSVTLTTFLSGVTGGVLDAMVKNITKNETGHVRITTVGYEDRSRFMPLDELIADPGAIRSAIASDPELKDSITAVAERITFGTLLSNGTASVSALGMAGDPETERGLLNLDRSVVQGRYLSGSGEAILGKKAAEDLNLAVGDSLRVVTQGADYSLRLKRFAIVGLFATGLNQLDSSAFQIGIGDAKDFLRTEGGVQQILVMLKDYRKADGVAARIKTVLGEKSGDAAGAASGADAGGGVDGGAGGALAVRPWTEIGDYPRLIGMMESLYGWIFVVVSFLGAFIISNILMMVVLERRREIGILKSMGLKRREILVLFVAEGAIMGALGSAAGALLGLGICGIFSVYGFDFSASMGSINFPIDPVLYTQVKPLAALTMFAIGLGVSIAVSILPSRRAATMNAVDAIKSVA
jgi:putative ABC transport system permease protein